MAVETSDLTPSNPQRPTAIEAKDSDGQFANNEMGGKLTNV